MRKPEQAAEPSIEEILASIRRIIADDSPQPAAVAEDMSEMRLQAYAGERRIRAVEPAPRAPEQRERGSEDEVLELTEDFMLAEEASAMELREPAEPAEVMTADDFDSRFSSQTYDPYDDQSSGQGAEPEAAAAEPEAEPAEEPAPSPTKGLASVMAEVQRFTGFGRSAEPKPVAAAPEPEQAQTTEGSNDLEADSTSAPNWGQPGFEMPGADSARRPASRWSARSKSNDAAKPGEPQAPTRPAARADTPAARDASVRKPAFGGRDSWSEGVQMPVPQEGPAMPFGVEENVDLPPLPPLGPSAATPQKPSMPAGEATDSGDVGKALAAGLQLRAEQLAAQAVADFASDRLSTVTGKPVVTDILKSDRPLMEEITSTLADALSKTDDGPQEFEDAAPPMEDLVDEDFAPGATAAPVPGQSQDMTGMQPLNLDGGFVAGPLAGGLAKGASIPTDQDTPELPREDGDDLAPMPEAFAGPVPTYSSPASVEASMPQMSTPPARMTTQPGPVVSGGTGVERLQPSMSGVKSLEETVREMLKPLLVQWLNENMPRIINDALRQEMASSGLLPRLEKDRR
jgi:hypothetical protein